MTTPRLRFAARRCASASFIVRCEGSGPARRCGGKSNGKRYRRQKRPTAQALPQHIVVGDASRAAERYARAFGARERSRVPLPGGSLLVIRVDRAEALDGCTPLDDQIPTLMEEHRVPTVAIASSTAATSDGFGRLDQRTGPAARRSRQ